MKRSKEYKWWERLIYGKRTLDILKRCDEAEKATKEALDEMGRNIEFFNTLTNDISNTSDENERNRMLKDAYEKMGSPFPWEGDFDEFMSDPNNCLDFSK